MGFKSNDQLAGEARSHIRHKAVEVGRTYRITDGTYRGRLAKVHHTLDNPNFVVITLLDAWSKETKDQDVVPVKYLE